MQNALSHARNKSRSEWSSNVLQLRCEQLAIRLWVVSDHKHRDGFNLNGLTMTAYAQDECTTKQGSE